MRSREAQRREPASALGRAVMVEDPDRLGVGWKPEGFKGLDELAAPVAINTVSPVWALDQHPSGPQSTRVERDHRTLDPQLSDGVDLTTGLGREEVDQLDPQLAAEGLRRGVDAHRRGDSERQAFRHPSIVPLAIICTTIRSPLGSDNARLTMEDHVIRTGSPRAGAEPCSRFANGGGAYRLFRANCSHSGTHPRGSRA